MMTGQRHRLLTGSMVLAGLLMAFNGHAAEGAQGWQHTVFFYGMGAAIDGNAQIGPVEVAIDVSASEVIDALEFGAMLAYRADNGTWSFTGDATFMGLGATHTTDSPPLRSGMDVDQLTLMATFGRRWTEHLEALFGLAYVDLSMSLSVKSTQGGPVDQEARRDADWVDPTLGLQYSRPLGDKWRMTLRGDVGGFGIGSDIMYHLLGSFRWQASEKVGVFFGYRIISFDYEEGSGLDYQRYDLTEQGPMIGISASF